MALGCNCFHKRLLHALLTLKLNNFFSYENVVSHWLLKQRNLKNKEKEKKIAKKSENDGKRI